MLVVEKEETVPESHYTRLPEGLVGRLKSSERGAKNVPQVTLAALYLSRLHNAA